MDDDLERVALAELHGWYAGEARQKEAPVPSRSALFAALVVLERMRQKYPLVRQDFVTRKGQVSKLNAKTVMAILTRHGENRSVPVEAGRTTRGSVEFADGIVTRLGQISALDASPDDQRLRVIEQLQAQIVQWLQQDHLNRERIKVDVVPHKTFERMIGDVLRSAGNPGAVAQYLVGAKLALRFPEKDIENHHSTAGDLQTGRPGDFLVGSTVFHVTMAPADMLIQKCHRNVREGYRVFLLVPSWRTAVARGLIEDAGLRDVVSTEASIESFVGQNLAEISGFRQDAVIPTYLDLLQKYNERVNQVEPDTSLQFEIPKSLQDP